MRILIVNAHDRKPEYQKAFQDLLACIKEVLRSHNGLLEIQDEYIIRTRDGLDDFLYDENTSFSQINPGKQFDSLDFVIVSGDLHSLPWHPSNVKVLTLLRMCLKVKKCLFAIGFAMQALVFLSASNLNHDVNVINGGGKGGKLGDIGQLQIPPENIAAHDLFLDNVTGDLYYFQYETNEWAPLCNIGLHHSRTAQEYNTIGKFVIKTPIYRPKKLINSVVNTTLLDENVEIKCFLKKIYLKHWLFQSCDMEFVVPCKGRWETHPFNFTNKEKTFEVLAESQHGPLVIEYPRIVGVKFSVTKRYKETYQMFSNFIVKYSDDIICKGKAQNMSILAHITHPDAFTSSYRFNAKHTPEIDPGIEALSQRPGTSHHQKALMGFKHRKVATDSSPPPDNADGKVFKHSGLATKMKGKFILDHNYISSGKVRYDSQIQSPSRENSKFLTKETLMGKYALLPKKMQTEDDLSFVDNTNTKESYDRSILKTANMSYRNNKRGKVKGVSIYEQQKGIVKHTMEDDASLTKEDVRRWLYPDLNELKGEFDKKAWVPGNLSSNKSETFYGSRSIRINTCSPDYRKKGPLPNYNLDPSETQQKSLRAADPYKSLHDLIKEHQKKEDEKIIGPRKFNLSKNSGVTQNLSGSPSSRFTSISMLKPKDWL